MMNSKPLSGFGCVNFNLGVYIANVPNMREYQTINGITALSHGEISVINNACGNGWRKVFNVYAKLLYALNKNDFNFSSKAPTWQTYRDKNLLQLGSRTALLFSPPCLNRQSNTLHIICGKTYAKTLIKNYLLNVQLIWLDEEFAIDPRHHLIVCPYFDYRQLSNSKIERLAVMLSQLINKNYQFNE